MATMSPLRRRMIEDMTIRNLSRSTQQAVRYVAPDEPGLARVKVTVRQNDIMCVNEALITVTNELLAQINPATAHARGMPGYTFERAPGETWRSKFDTTRNLIVVNNGHRDLRLCLAHQVSEASLSRRSWCCTTSPVFLPTTCLNGWSSFHCARKSISRRLCGLDVQAAIAIGLRAAPTH